MNCISCNFDHSEKYCPNCGEKSGTKKITFTTIVQDAFSTITYMDKGFLFNVKQLIVDPQKIAVDYVLGIRKKILNPISFLIISVSIYLLVWTFFKLPNDSLIEDANNKAEMRVLSVEVGKFIGANLKYFWILSIIPLGVFLKLVFQKYNYFEYLAISSFIIGQATLVGSISFLLFRFILIFDPFIFLTIFWLVFSINKRKNNFIESLLLALSVLIMFVIQLVIIIAGIAVLKNFTDWI